MRPCIFFALVFALFLAQVSGLYAKPVHRLSVTSHGHQEPVDWNSITSRVSAPGEDWSVQNFGDSIAASKNWLFVSAESVVANAAHRLVYIYQKSGDGWKNIQVLKKKTADLGYTIIMSRKQAFIMGRKYEGDKHTSYNAVFVYTNEDGRWRQSGIISPVPIGSMAYNGKELFIADKSSHSIHIYAERNKVWKKVANLSGKEGFGSYFSVSKMRMVVWSYGAGGFPKGHGKLSIFEYKHGIWRRTVDIRPVGIFKDYIFGPCVMSSRGDTIFVAAGRKVPPVGLTPKMKREMTLKGVADVHKETILREEAVKSHESEQVKEHNQVFVFRKRASGWKLMTRVAPKNPGLSASFGRSLWLYGNQLFVGAPRANIIGNGYWNGAVYVFKEKAGVWHQIAKLTGNHPKVAESFGTSLAVSGWGVFVGAPSAQVKGKERGAVYIFGKWKTSR